MKAMLLREPKELECIDIEEPSSPGPGEALVQVHRVGICGTDYSGYLGKMPFFSYPRIPGHELGVEVLEVGEGVGNVAPGARCSVEPYINNPDSFASRRGRGNCCEELQVLGVHTDGGLRSRFIVPARKLHPSATLEFEQLALVETLGIGCHCVDRAKVEKDEYALVIGAGPIGLSVIEFLRLAGARIALLEASLSRLEMTSKMMGIERAIQFRGDGSEEEALRAAGGGELPTCVIDATGNVQSMSHALNYVAHTGRLVYVGLTTENIQFPHKLMHSREMTLISSRNALPRDFTRIIGLIEEEKIDTRPWITHHTDFANLPLDLPAYTDPECGVIKAVVEVE